MTRSDFNKVILTGRPTAKPELKLTTAGTSVMNFTLRSEGVKHREHIDVTVWGELAEKVHQDLCPEGRIMVEGSLHRKNEGQNPSGTVEITANRIFSLGD